MPPREGCRVRARGGILRAVDLTMISLMGTQQPLELQQHLLAEMQRALDREPLLWVSRDISGERAFDTRRHANQLTDMVRGVAAGLHE